MKLFKLIRAWFSTYLFEAAISLYALVATSAARLFPDVIIVSIVGRIFNDRSLSCLFCLKCQLPVLIGYETRDISCE